jgi:hypothetical protein
MTFNKAYFITVSILAPGLFRDDSVLCHFGHYQDRAQKKKNKNHISNASEILSCNLKTAES